MCSFSRCLLVAEENRKHWILFRELQKWELKLMKKGFFIPEDDACRNSDPIDAEAAIQEL